jgi:hypothetical protein
VLPDGIESIPNLRGRIAAILDIRAPFGLSPHALPAGDEPILCDVFECLLALRADTTVYRACACKHTCRRVPAGAVMTVVWSLEEGLLLIADKLDERGFLERAGS